MAALIIPNTTSFGSLTNQTVSRVIAINTAMERLRDAIATAASGYDGVPGTEYEAVTMTVPPNENTPNNFGVQPDPKSPGSNGVAYAYAVNVLSQHWQTFWAAAEASINQLDNGSSWP